MKPGNILVASYDGRPVPKVIDFGIAKATGQQLTERTLFTALGQIVGTIEYMSPEQATRNQLDVDTRSDVYSLGVVLYELLTGETPLDRQRLRTAAWDEMLRIIREEEPPRPSVRLSSSERLPSIAASRGTEPSKLSSIMRGELDWIVIKALEKDRSRRYESAGQFAADIRRYLSNEAVLACPPSNIYRFRKFIRRNAYTMTFLSVIIASLVLGLGTSAWQARRARLSERDAVASLAAERKARMKANAEQENARQSQRSAEAALKTASQRLSQVYAERGLARLDVEPHAGLPWLAEALRTDRDDRELVTADRLRFSLMRTQVPNLLEYWPSTRHSEMTVDEKQLAVMSRNEVLIYSLPDMHTTTTLAHSHPVERMVWNAAGDRIATLTAPADGPPLCQIWDISTGSKITESVDLSDQEFGMRETPELRFSPDGKLLIVSQAGLYNRWHSKVVVRLYDASSLRQISQTFAHHSDLDFTAGYHQFSPDLRHIAVPRGTTADDTRANWNEQGDVPEGMDRVQQYDLITAKPAHAPLASVSDGYDIPVYSPDGTQLATSEAGVVKLWSAVDGTLVREFRLSKETAHASVWFHPDNQHLVLLESNLAYVLNKNSGEERTRYSHERKFFVSSAGKYCVYLDYNGNHYLAPLIADDATTDHRILPAFTHITFSPDDSVFNLHLANKGESGFAYQSLHRIYQSSDLCELTPPWRFSGRLSSSGRYLLCQNDSGTWLWELDATQQIIKPLQLPHGGPYVDSAASRDRRLLATLSPEGWLQVTNTETLQQEITPFVVPGQLSETQLIKWEYIVSDDRMTRIAVIGSLKTEITPGESQESHVVQIWDPQTRRPLFQPLVFAKADAAWFDTGFFSRDGGTYILPEVITAESPRSQASQTNTDETHLRILDSTTGRPVQETIRFSSKLSFVELTDDGRRCLVVSDPQNYWDSAADTDNAGTGNTGTGNKGFVQMLSTETWEPVSSQMQPKSGGVGNARLLPNDVHLVVGNGEIWDTSTGTLVLPALVTHQLVLEINVNPDGNSLTLLSGRNNSWVDRSSEIRVFSVQGKPLAAPMTSIGTFATSCTRHPTQPILAEAGNRLRFWDVSRGLALSESLAFPTSNGWKSDSVRQLFFTPSGDHLVIDSDDGLFFVAWKEVAASVQPDDEILAWSSILSGAKIDAAGGLIPLQTDEIHTAWLNIRRRSQVSREN